MVRFQASGMRELAWHLFTWGDKVQILGPQLLKEMMLAELELALACHRRAGASDTDAGAAQTAAP
jgi:predicted DNA-binding transcriptional regulator YafY